jgi:hypothetical protein
MMPQPKARLLTAFVIIALCAFTVPSGWSVARFALDTSGGEDPANVARSWTAVAGIGSTALEMSAGYGADPTDVGGAQKRAKVLRAAVRRHPLSSDDWLSLAGALFASQDSFNSVLVALGMSSLTGANEGSVMFRRGTFGLLLWDGLPPEARARVITDLAAPILAGIVFDRRAEAAKSLLDVADANKRQEITDRLRAEGISAKDLGRIGL